MIEEWWAGRVCSASYADRLPINHSAKLAKQNGGPGGSEYKLSLGSDGRLV